VAYQMAQTAMTLSDLEVILLSETSLNSYIPEEI